MSSQIPIVDISPLVLNLEDKQKTVQSISDALKEWGFFYVTGHGVDTTLQHKVEELGRQFFAQPLEVKNKSNTGSPVCGYQQVGLEHSFERIDVKEGYLVWIEYDDYSDIPEYTKNVYPNEFPHFKETVLQYISVLRDLGDKILEGIALSLNLDRNYFEMFTKKEMKPSMVLKYNNYPPLSCITDKNFIPTDELKNCWGIGEHCDYGLLTILQQDSSGGLQVKTRSNVWIDAIPIDNTFVCNIGDMVERMTRGMYRSTPHRVKITTNSYPRLSIPFFIAPNWNAVVNPIESIENLIIDDYYKSIDGVNVHEFTGTFNDYITYKHSKRFY